MGCVILVDPERLNETPAAFQEYVRLHFLPKEVLGKQVLVASAKLSWSYTDYESMRRPQGVAPSHSCDLMRFKKGLKAGQNLNEWMRENDGKYLWQLYASDDYAGCSWDDD